MIKVFRTLVKSAYQKNNFLNETVLLSTQNMLKLMGKKIFTI